ncbi:hydantoinase/oxoprolinase family protein [Nisaea acidiphila]|uniref:Hydantoinase/oxoprolinase family protein n=1 Tax=Nisaea acidiphila TaxID=1862145 RepID=A0A9J7AVJ2_9PROT|nr:hydantoinase/oxoprolinase family protein [Nisaea acidiphila]UUX50308.1 hydantoinase/oxoprolinase family protein [Nisaea acidiphila]
MSESSIRGRLAVDVGGTFTDVALEFGPKRYTAKVLTTPAMPERGVMNGIEKALEVANANPADIGLLIHGTTLATNALIERKGAKTALITTEGLRDSVEMAFENRFEQYDINIDRPDPLVPRNLRWPVRERLNFKGEVLIPLDESSVEALVPLIDKHEIGSIAVGLIHSYANGAHEERVGEILSKARPDLSITLSSEVCPEIREYERQSTASANAYVRPIMSRYLGILREDLKKRGFDCPVLLMTSGGGLTSLDTAMRFPIRLVESGPAGGAILASEIARECDLSSVVSFDMGGTTAKICLLDDFLPQMTRTFEVARVYRNMKGSGWPVRIPAIEMVEIGAGGGSLATIDKLGRIAVGPESAGADPGPASYDQGGTQPAVTDADVVLGKIDPEKFAGGSVALKPEKAEAALKAEIGEKMGLTPALSAFGVCEIVDENMANAARVHAIEWGKDIAARAMIAFGGAAPLHAARLAEKLDIPTVVVPTGAGVGSAIGFLRAPISYEVVRSRYMKLSDFDAGAANALLAEMGEEARAIVESGAQGAKLAEGRTAFMRYVGQGHEIAVQLPAGALTAEHAEEIRAAFETEYKRLYGRIIPGPEPEILSWTLNMTAPSPETETELMAPKGGEAIPTGSRKLFDPATSDYVDAAIYWRDDLPVGAKISGPALVAEAQTTTVVTSVFDAAVNELGYLVLTRKSAA